MTAENAVKTPIGTKEQPNKYTAPLFVPETIMTALPVVERLADGGLPEPQDVSAVVSDVARDLKAQGVPITSDDIKAIESQALEGLRSVSPSRSASSELKAPILPEELPDINMKEYQVVIDDFVRNYGLDKGTWNTIAGILVASDAGGQVLNGMYRRKFQTGEGWRNLSYTFKDQISRRILGLNKVTPGQLAQKVKSMKKDDWKKIEWKSWGGRGTEIGRLAWEAAWPVVVSPAYAFLERKGVQMAGKMFMTERARLQEQVNNRIADSLFMRNFEFLHDKSSAEMLQVINNGKDATVDLVSAIYENLIPLKWAQWSSVLSQGIVSTWDMAAAAFKKLYLDTKTKPNARQIQVQRSEELKQWDKVNTKLLTTLQGLETARTSGSSEGGSDIMYASLAQRDFVEAGGLREKRMQEKAINKLFDFLDFGIPFVTEGIDITKKVTSGMVPTDDGLDKREMKVEDMFSQIFQGYFRVRGSQAEQQMLRQSFLQLTHLYTDRIIPDIQDIKRMEELLGPYGLLDHPMGLRERTRLPASAVKNFDIHIKNLKFKQILNGVNLDIPQGSFVTIKGPSGIGKSTLFRHLVGLYQIESGSVQYGGTDIDGIKKYGPESLYTRIAYANQSPQYFEDMTLRENLLLWSPKNIPAGRIETVLKDLKLDKLMDRLDTKEKHFSGGELRRIGIARALLKDPKVLFLDEPTANLDAASTLQVMHVIQELRKTRPDMTVVAITHDPVFEKISEHIVDFEKLNKKPILAENQVYEAKAKAI